MSPRTMPVPHTRAHSVAVALLISAGGCSSSLLATCEYENTTESTTTSEVDASPADDAPEESEGDKLREQSRGLLVELTKRVGAIDDQTERDSMRVQLAYGLAQFGSTEDAVQQVGMIEAEELQQQARLGAALFIAEHGDAASVAELIKPLPDSMQEAARGARVLGYARSGDVDSALEINRKSTVMDPAIASEQKFDHATVLIFGVDGMIRRGDLDSARSLLKQAEELYRSQSPSPTKDRHLEQVGNRYVGCGDLKAASNVAAAMSSSQAATLLNHRIAVALAEVGNLAESTETASRIDVPLFRGYAMAAVAEAQYKAGSEADGELSFREAKKAAWTAFENGENPLSVIDLFCEIATRQHGAGRTTEAIQTLDEAREPAMRNDRTADGLLIRIARVYRTIGHSRGADEIVEERLKNSISFAKGAFWHANELRLLAEVRSDPEAARDILVQAEAVVENGTDRSNRVESLVGIASSYDLIGDPESVARCFAHARQVAREITEARQRTRALEVIAKAHAEQGNLDTAIAILDDFATAEQQAQALLKIATALRFAANRADAEMEQ